MHKDDIIAIKVPINSTLDALQSKINDRLGAQVHLQYKAESSKDRLPLKTELDMEEAFAMSIKVGKLTVYADDDM
jgi:bud emergence protein 1